MRILVVDNYDSFVYNLVQYLGQLDVACDVRATTRSAWTRSPATTVSCSPGPGTPAQAGICMDLIGRFCGTSSNFRVCLGHQAIAEVYGATVSRAPELLQRKDLWWNTTGGSVHRTANPMTATRYHSAGRGAGHRALTSWR